MGWLRSLAVAFALIAVLFASLPILFDFGQCTRACVVKFGGLNNYHVREPNRRISGFWTLADRIAQRDRCFCEERKANGGLVELGNVPRLFKEEELGFPYIWRDQSVCALDGKVYPSASAAKSSGTKTLHCGPYCGDCSTVHDLKRYYEIGGDVAKVVGPCIFTYLVAGTAVDGACMSSRAKFTPACNECWIEDHGCLGAHCFHDCIFKGRKHWERLLGLNDPSDTTDVNDACILCMEKYCSAPFIRTCGVNRRGAGIRTDLGRDEREICKLVDVSSL